jgi:OmcA/MtrC family decaheme c-type cytochrome
MKRSWALVFAGALALSGCSGEDGGAGPQGAPGSDGTPGAPGVPGTPGPIGPGQMAVESCAVCHGDDRTADVRVVHGLTTPAAAPYTVDVTGLAFVADGAGVSRLQVEFSVLNGTTPVTGLLGGSSGNVRMTVAKLVPGAGNIPSSWVSYVIDANSTRPTNERGTLTDLGSGNYRYRFATDVAAAAGYDAAANHRLAFQISGGSFVATNKVVDFNGFDLAAPPTATRNVVSTASCNECHDPLVVHGSRYETGYCVTCHNPGRAAGTATRPAYLRDGEILGDMMVMVHKAHMSHGLSKADYNYAGVKFNEITYPQDPRNCTKCHKDGADAGNWATKPTRATCGSCHDGVNFATGAGHSTNNIAQADDAGCTVCHSAAAIGRVHATAYAGSTNPPAGAAVITYAISDVSVNEANQAVVTFRVQNGGADMDLVTAYPPAGFTGGPSFLVAYASPQDDVAVPNDWNQLGRAAGQPASVSLASLKATGAAGLDASTRNADGSYTVTLPASAAFPVGAVMRGIALQGYFTQSNVGARHAVSVFRGVTGDPVRRAIVDDNKCLSCHEALELHGGNRVNTTAVCAVCHNPNLSSSGRAADPVNITAEELLAAYGTNPLVYPEDSQNLKNLVHGIHAGHMREIPFEHVRDRGTSGVYYYDWSHVTYPGRLENCEGCHVPGSYEASLSEGVLMTTTRTTSGDAAEDRATILAARAAVPNATDEVQNATTAACFSCHANVAGGAHMQQNGGGFNTRGVILDSRD